MPVDLGKHDPGDGRRGRGLQAGDQPEPRGENLVGEALGLGDAQLDPAAEVVDQGDLPLRRRVVSGVAAVSVVSA
jgi:hypothetical protein